MKLSIKLLSTIFAIAISSYSWSQSEQDTYLDGMIGEISTSKKTITIDGVQYLYNRDTNFYIKGLEESSKEFQIEVLEPGAILRYQSIETKKGLLLLDVGWITG